MLNQAKLLRLRRIMDIQNNRIFILPMDHGVTVGPIEGLIDMHEAVHNIVGSKINCVVVHKGIVRSIQDDLKHDARLGLIVHLFASTSISPDPNDKQVVCSVKHALALGADAVSIHVNVGAVTETKMLKDFALISEECHRLNVPLLAMMYARGPKVKVKFSEAFNAHAARIAYELGADIIKLGYTGDVDSFSRVVQCVKAPVVIAGGEKMNSTREMLQMVYDSLQAGGAGVAFGRNVFSTEHPRAIADAIGAIIHDNASVDDALDMLAVSGGV